jgi:hypothetical protein
LTGSQLKIDKQPMRFKKQNKLITIVDNGLLLFVQVDRRGRKKAVDSVKLADLLLENTDSDPVPFSTKHRINKLLIVPDYWFGNDIYKFQSTKKSLVDAFIERKLQAQYPQLAEVKHFFDSISYQRAKKERWLYAYFLQDSQFFELYRTLSRLKLTPHRITSPALIRGSKIRQMVPDFDEGGKCLIELQHNIYHLFFFFEGNFLFSRSIPLADLPVDSPDNLQAITYELNQSQYLFSQRAKAEVNTLYLISQEKLNVGELSEALGKEVNNLTSAFNELKSNPPDPLSVDPVDSLDLLDSISNYQFLCVSHKRLKKELEWRPVQTAGMAIALFLCILLGTEAALLHKWSHRNEIPAVDGKPASAGNTKQKIRQYNEALDMLIEDAGRLAPRQVIAKLAGSLPPDIRMKELILQAETEPALEFKGVSKDLGPEHIKASLSVLVANLNQNLRLRRAIAIPDIDIELDSNKQSYFLKFRMELQ